MESKGFTLIELLAVIVILAIIALIATPLILGVIEDARISSYKESVRNGISATELYLVGNIKDKKSIKDSYNVTSEFLKIKNIAYKSGTFDVLEDETIVANNVLSNNGRYCAKGSKEDLEVIAGACSLLNPVPPENPLLSVSSISTDSVTLVMASTSDNIKAYYYRIDGGNWIKMTGSYHVVQDLVSNKKYKFEGKIVNEIDLEALTNEIEVTTKSLLKPTINVSTTNITKEDVVVDIVFPIKIDGIKHEYSIDSGVTFIDANDSTVSLTVSEKTTIIARVSNTNESVIEQRVIDNIDKIKPTISATLSNIDGVNGWYKSFPAVNIVTSDDNAGEGYKYAISYDGGVTYGSYSALTFDSSFKISSQGNNIKVKAYSIDKVGNESEIYVSSIIKIDTIAPTCVSSGGNTAAKQTPVTITGTCSDALSGCSGNINKSFNTTTSLVNQSPGIVKDNAGNQTTCPANQPVNILILPAAHPTDCFGGSIYGGGMAQEISMWMPEEAVCPLNNMRIPELFDYSGGISMGGGSIFSTQYISNGTFSGKGFTGTLIIPGTIKLIEANAFSNNKITRVIILTDIKTGVSIDATAFSNNGTNGTTTIVPEFIKVN